MTRMVYGYQQRMPTKTYEDYPEIRAQVERMVRERFVHECGFEPSYLEWRHEPEQTYEVDGETVTLPPMSMYIVEGVEP